LVLFWANQNRHELKDYLIGVLGSKTSGIYFFQVKLKCDGFATHKKIEINFFLIIKLLKLEAILGFGRESLS
jgi:hypothetical protein